MASLEKVRKYMAVTESEKLSEQMVAQIVGRMKAYVDEEDMDEDMNEEMAAEIEGLESTMKKANEIAKREMENALAELFSDEELDELIILCSNPVTIHMKKVQPELMQRIMDAVQKELMQEEAEELCSDQN